LSPKLATLDADLGTSHTPPHPMTEAAESDREIIRVASLSKSFAGQEVVRDLSLSVPRGQILGLLGPNGAGKSTTLHLLLGLTRASSGSIRIFGRELNKGRRSVLSRVNFSSAYTSLPTNLSMWENLNIFAKLYGIRKPRAKIHKLLELFEIPHTLHALTGALSSSGSCSARSGSGAIWPGRTCSRKIPPRIAWCIVKWESSFSLFTPRRRVAAGDNLYFGSSQKT